jgi:hypothetical protein
MNSHILCLDWPFNRTTMDNRTSAEAIPPEPEDLASPPV